MKLKWLTGTVREILESGHSYIIEGPNRKQYRKNRAHLKPVCHNGSSFEDHLKARKKNSNKSDNPNSFQDPRPKHKKSMTFEDSPLVFPSIPLKENKHKMSEITSSASHSSWRFPPHSPSSSPPAQLSSRETLVSPTTEDRTAQRHPAFIRPQDVNTQLTTGLAILVQETSPLAPYKIQRSAKRKARQAFSTQC